MLSLWTVGLIEAAIVGATLYNAYTRHKQFFPICVYLLKSNVSLAVLLSATLYAMILTAYGIKQVLFGSLRLIEAEHLQEYGWLTVSESFLAMTTFRDEFDAKFIILFTSVLLVKAFHWIAKDRVDYMEQTPRLPQYFHPRMLTSLYLLAAIDLWASWVCIRSVIEQGPSMSILFANEFVLLLVSLLSMAVRYGLNSADLRRGSPWEHRSIFLFYFDFAIDLMKLLIYSAFFGVIVYYYGIPLHIIRDLYLTFRSFVLRVQDIVRYRQATSNMDQRYPDAAEEELARTDRICIICREEMTSAKKLPCGHLFHFRCLRSWLERQQACPTCRRPILDDPADGAGNNVAPPAPEAGPAPVDVPAPPADPNMIYPNPGAAPTNEGNAMNVQMPRNADSLALLPPPHVNQAVPILMVPPEQIDFVHAAEPPAGMSGEQNEAPHQAHHNGAYVLRPEGRELIYLEPIDAPYLSAWPAHRVQSDHLSLEQVDDVRQRARSQLRRELDVLAGLQMDISYLVNRLSEAESQLASMSSSADTLQQGEEQAAQAIHVIREARHRLRKSKSAEKDASDSDLGKERMYPPTAFSLDP